MAQLPGRDPAALTTRVSIVVPSRNQGRFLRSCLDSLLAQAPVEPEVLLHDNLSSDETSALLEEYRPRLARVRRERDAGQADALRRGFAAASGEVFGWLNADDMLMPGALQRVARLFESDPELDVVYGHCALLDGDGQFLRYFEETAPFDRHELLNDSDTLAQPSTFFRRRAYERVGGVDAGLHYTMDWDLWCRFARAGCRFQLLDDVLSGARIHASAKTTRGGFPRWLEITRVNLRHTTRRLPPVPLLRVASLVSDSLAQRAPLLHSAARALWRGTVFARPPRPARPPGPAAEAPRVAALRFPVFAWTHAVEARLGFPVGAVPPPEAVAFELDGWSSPDVTRDGSELRASWRAKPTFVQALRLSARVRGDAGAAASRLRCRFERAPAG